MPPNREPTVAGSETDSYSRVLGDLRRSLTLGPVAVILNLAAYALIYPLIVRRFGYSTIGLWGLMTAILTAMTAADIGFSLQVQRDTSLSMSESQRDGMKVNISASRGLYTGVWMLAVGAVILAQPLIHNRAENIYPGGGLFFSVILVTTSAWVILLANLDRAVLIGLQDAPFTYIASISTPVITFAVGLVGVLNDRPIEGLAIAALTSSLVLIGMFRLRLNRRHRSWSAARQSGRSFFDLKRAMRFAAQGSGFYAGSIGMVLRQPLVLFITAGVAGLVGVAAVDIAFRATNAARGLATAGTAPMLSSFALLSQQFESRNTLRFTQDSLVTILERGVLPVTTVIAFAPLLPLWLGESNAELVGTTQIIALWGLLTLFNVPFWYCLQANHDERFAALTVWIHTLSLVALLPLSRVLDVSVVIVACYWLGAGILTQIGIFVRIQKRFMPLSSVFEANRVRILTVLAVVGAVIAIAASIVFEPAKFGNSAMLIGAWLAWSAIYVMLVATLHSLQPR